MATPCALGIVTAWWSQGSQFLKWGPGFQKQVPSEQEKSCMAFFCLVFFPFNNLMEIQFTYHTIFPFKKYLSVVSVYSEFFNHHYSQLQNILIAPQKKLCTLACSPNPRQPPVYFLFLYRFAYFGHFMEWNHMYKSQMGSHNRWPFLTDHKRHLA